MYEDADWVYDHFATLSRALGSWVILTKPYRDTTVDCFSRNRLSKYQFPAYQFLHSGSPRVILLSQIDYQSEESHRAITP